MYASALVAIDFSPATRQLLQRADRLRRLGTNKLVLLHVLPRGGDVEDAMERLQTKAAKLDPAFEIECLVREGKPGRTILEVAEERELPLIVLAARNHSLARRLVLGSVADEVVHWTSRAVPLESAVSGTDGRDRVTANGPVLVATDGSDVSKAAEDLALNLANGGALRIVSVVDGEALEWGWSVTSRVLELAEKRGIPTKRSVETGRPGEVIARIAALNSASLIVVGRRRTAQRGLGSTAQIICERANRPVLLVPAA